MNKVKFHAFLCCISPLFYCLLLYSKMMTGFCSVDTVVKSLMCISCVSTCFLMIFFKGHYTN